jgi:FKBP-type peptidyl-prolyl cis-trans isomerase FkpA/FKBP-type peptidyl-prolyl cis-trans isomerase FklB
MGKVLLYIALFAFAAAVPVRAAEEAAEAAEESVAAESAETGEAAAEAVELETPVQRLSYALGMEIAKSLKSLETEISLPFFFKGLQAQFEGRKPSLTEEEALAIKKEFFEKKRQEQMAAQQVAAKENSAEAEAFLEKHKEQPNVKTTESGLQYQVLEEGKGPKPKATDTVKVNYKGTLLDGTVFDSSYDRGQPATFPLNRVIPGWTEGVQLMNVGSKYKFWVPPDLGYGSRDLGQIPPNSVLVFEVELLEIVEGDGAGAGQ